MQTNHKGLWILGPRTQAQDRAINTLRCRYIFQLNTNLSIEQFSSLVGSTSKSFTSAAMYLIVDDGKFPTVN